MASMVFASSPLNAQSFVKLITNSNYSHYSCYVPSPSRVHLSYKNISHIESSKSLFIKGDNNFSFSSPKFPRVASTYSPSLNIIKACIRENVYHYPAYDLKKGHYVQLNDDYQGMILLIVNIPVQRSIWTKGEIEFLNDLREHYKGKTSWFGRGFEVLGFFHDIEELDIKKPKYKKENEEIPEYPPGEEILMGEEEVLKLAKFPLFRKVKVNNNHDEHFWNIHFWNSNLEDGINNDLWFFLRKSLNTGEIKEEFEKILVDGNGIPVKHLPRFDGETLKPRNVKPGEFPGELGSELRVINPSSPVKEAIDEYYRRDNTQY
ncbi:uncharacterized protein LOC129890376 [Solanum dulcamara]|uniref:uncharacterized protein LOC129890376 n=1 Tax=Solanum dulcamara TaxID=45834 RepID=UPI00248656B4|nr:uncharacterized protein LOC129890376 [Solanum dulcamara]